MVHCDAKKYVFCTLFYIFALWRLLGNDHEKVSMPILGANYNPPISLEITLHAPDIKLVSRILLHLD